MGTTYIPSGKQPDWKHNPDSSSTGEGYLNNSNTAASQHNASNMPAQIGHLAAGPVSPLPPMASQLAMFDVSPFQSTPDMSVQGRWSHVHASPLQPAVPSLSLQQQAEGVLPSQFSQGRSIDKSLASNRFPESQTSTPSDSNPKFPVNSELGFVEQSSSTIAAAASAHGSSLTKNADIGNTGVQNVGGIESGYQKSNSGVKTPSSPQKNITSQNYSHQRGSGGVSQKNDSGEWSHRRMGFQGRNQSIGGDKYVKLKQIYVAKQTSNGTST